MEKQAHSEYSRLSKDDLIELQYTGDWELDRKRFTSEYSRNIEVLKEIRELGDYDWEV